MHCIVYGSKKKQQTIIQAKQLVNIEAQQCVRQAQRVNIETNQLLWTVHNASRRFTSQRVAGRNLANCKLASWNLAIQSLASWSVASRSKEGLGNT